MGIRGGAGFLELGVQVEWPEATRGEVGRGCGPSPEKFLTSCKMVHFGAF